MKAFLAVLATSACLLVTWSCSPGNFTQTEGIENYEEMKLVMNQLIPTGTPFDLAKAKMEKEGFECTVQRNSSFSEQGVGIENIDYVYCDRHDYSGPYESLRWQAALILEKEKVTRVALSKGIVGL